MSEQGNVRRRRIKPEVDTSKSRVEYVKLAELKRWNRNPKLHDIAGIKASIERFGFNETIVVDEATKSIVAGHGRLESLEELFNEGKEPPTRIQVAPDGEWMAPVLMGITFDNVKEFEAYLVANNRLTQLGGWEKKSLGEILADMDNFDGVGFTSEDADELLKSLSAADLSSELPSFASDDEDVPEADESKPARSRTGDVYVLGSHRLMCGDSTNADDVAVLLDGERAVLIHADPPYGMGKESAGVENDNIYGSKLDAFQMSWWRTYRAHLLDNASAYIWGNAEALWRLWFAGGLGSSEFLTLKNEIVWDKQSAIGKASPLHRMYPTATERCLFFMFGPQEEERTIDTYWEGFEPIRTYLEVEAAKLEWGPTDIKKITGVGMWQHWATRSQWVMITRENYELIQTAAAGEAFEKPYAELRAMYDKLRIPADAQRQAFYATRTYFDNAHQIMTDVWQYSIVRGEERHGHATPKPVDMIARAMVTSAPPGAIVVEPFIGSGSTLIACERTGRRCFGMEISPHYVDVAVARWEKATGEVAQLIRA